ncbi:MAG: hypothetical protein HY298_16755 [Verrucomicrobia bacterium]|nr:hypothetical protein [Verrucomicrobiota bacterium]
MPTRRTFLIQVAATSAALTTGVAATSKSPRPANAVGESRRRLLASIDCTQDLPPEKYFANGVTRVVETSAGRYREADGKTSARFGYRFAIEHDFCNPPDHVDSIELSTLANYLRN